MTRRLLPVDSRDTAAMLRALRAALTADGPAVFPHADAAQTRTAQAPTDQTHAAQTDAAQAIAARTDDIPGLPEAVSQRVAVVVQTSGSSGEPKRVALSADALLASAAASTSALGGSGQWLLALPAHYIAGVNVLVRSITADIDPVVTRVGGFDAEAFAAAVGAMTGDLRFTSLVPAQLGALLDSAAATSALRTFDRVLVGGQSLPQAVRDRAREAGVRVTTTYGSSETSGGCVYDGVPSATTRVRAVDGELEISGPMLAEGYLDAVLTANRFHTADGARWYRTGDAGFVDRAGDGVQVTVTGRLDRVIISGGVKVSLEAVERVVRTVPALADAVAVAIPDDRWGHVPVVVTRVGAPLDAIRDLVGGTLGREARPARIVIAPVPLLPNGKPDLVAAAVLARS
ncbi:MAG: hypothetical protein RI885_429 [Actinomycetota bacterium]|jgi:O-succinylbenzoic acid--CoA ligase